MVFMFCCSLLSYLVASSGAGVRVEGLGLLHGLTWPDRFSPP